MFALANIGTQIKEALGISGVLSNVYSWRTEADEDKDIEKTQIEFLIDRDDGVINLCEMKFSTQEYAIAEDEEMKLRRRRGNFIDATQTKKAIHITLVTPYGLKKNTDLQSPKTLSLYNLYSNYNG